jgi:hypothetical protein
MGEPGADGKGGIVRGSEQYWRIRRGLYGHGACQEDFWIEREFMCARSTVIHSSKNGKAFKTQH